MKTKIFSFFFYIQPGFKIKFKNNQSNHELWYQNQIEFENIFKTETNIRFALHLGSIFSLPPLSRLKKKRIGKILRLTRKSMSSDNPISIIMSCVKCQPCILTLLVGDLSFERREFIFRISNT